ncbi:MAG TPA: MBL fold metallo-hydrolase [Tepidisphaeraceae bacterium]|jgi:glyoxylase-like metal-dependent hydrolase (beta-lactamase superfamily II)
MDIEWLSEELAVATGAVATGILRDGDRAVLFDCDDAVTPGMLASIGIRHVDWIFSTQPRRPNLAGARKLIEAGAKLVVGKGAGWLLEKPADYWNAWTYRWENFKQQPVPEVPVEPLAAAREVEGTETMQWRGHTIEILAGLAPIMGSAAYLVASGGKRICFSGDYIYAPGQFYQLHAFQADYLDCCSFSDRRKTVETTLQKLRDARPSVIVPSHGTIMREADSAIEMTLQRCAELRETYQQTLRSEEMYTELPHWAKRIPNTTTLYIVSESGDAVVIDCGDDRLITAFTALRNEKKIRTIDQIYLTHYHQDHCWGTGHLYFTFPQAQVIADERVVDILRFPHRYRMPCLPHRRAPVTRVVKDGETWQWNEFKLTNYYFPGQTLYHSALLVEGHGQKILFTGDSFGSGLWLVDYCAANRMLVGEDEGYFRCLRRLREIQPDFICDAHNRDTFRWTKEQLDFKEQAFTRRVRLLEKMLPWEHPSFGLDEGWIRTYPYEQDAGAGAAVRIDVVFWNHGGKAATAEARPELPEGWRLLEKESEMRVQIAPRSEGAVRLIVGIPAGAKEGQVVVPINVRWNDKTLGSIRDALVRVW